MKAYFIRLFDYDHFANHAILNSMLSVNAPQKPVQLMAHLLAAQQIWLNRCNDNPNPGVALWPDWPVETFEKTIDTNHGEWLNFLDSLNANDLEKIITYKNSKGITFQNKLTDIFTHLINHGTHHRAQVGQQLKLAGVEKLPVTDYIFYIRT